MIEATVNPGPPTDGALPAASFGLRTLAKLTDLMVINFVSVVPLGVFVAFQAVGMPSVGLLPWLVVLFVLFCVFYLAIGFSGGRQTLGYRLAGLRVVLARDDTVPVGFGRGLARSILDCLANELLCYLVGLLDYLPVAFTASKRALHDLATGTRVVSIGRPRYPALTACAVALVVVPVVLVFGVVRPFLLQAYYLPSPSMTPTLPVGSGVLLSKVMYRRHAPRRGDIVAFHIPASAAAYYPANDDSVYIKRVIGIPGDELRMSGGQVILWNSGRPQALAEPYIAAGLQGEVPDPDGPRGPDDWFTRRRAALTRHGGHWWIQVPPGQYFVLGDNRNDSNDSHLWGFLPVQDIRGKITFMYRPWIQDFS